MLLVQSCKSLQIPLEISFERLLPHVVVVVIGVAIVLMVVVINAAIVVVRVRIVPGGNINL